MGNTVPTKTINPWLMIIPPILASFMCILDTTIGNVALPHMAGALSATRDESMWILTSYLVASGVIMPAVDWLSKIFGRKLYFIISISVFVLASILCGMAKSLGFMVFARVLQGLGGGGIVPIANAIIFEGFAPIQNLLKNVAGAVGTSLVSTLVTRYSQVHQYMLVANLTPLNPNYTNRLNYLISTFSGYSHDVAQKMAEGYLYKELVTQSTLFGYIDAFRVFGIVCFFIIPLLLLFRKQSKA